MGRVSKAMTTLMLLASGGFMTVHGDDTRREQPLRAEARQAGNPRTFKDDRTGVLFYVESDGQHVAAINGGGAILWHQDPFVEAGLKPYRTKERPVISYIGKASDKQVESLKAMGKKGPFIGLGYNSSQYGLLDVTTGVFTFYGQD